MGFNPKNYKGKKVTIMGLGLHSGGVGAARFFARLGAKVLVTDIRKKEVLAESLEKLKDLPIKYILGQHRSEDFTNTDLIIKNPAIPKNSKYLELAQKNKIPIETDIGIFFEICPSKKIIGVTGTRGKSTVTSLIAHFLKKEYKNVLTAGNIRTSVLDIIKKISPETYLILELSSWQLEGLANHKKSPWLAVITNIYPDHLNRYKSIEEYIAAKKIIFSFQSSSDFLVLNEENEIVRNFSKEAPSQVVFFNKKQIQGLADSFALAGEHNLENLAAATAAVKILGLNAKIIQKGAISFKGLGGRLEYIGQKEGIRFINDTTSTIPEATIAALKTIFESQSETFGLNKQNGLVLIAGGADKNLNFEKLADIVADKIEPGQIRAVLLLEGTATENLKKSLEMSLKTKHQDPEKFIFKFNSMQQAIDKSFAVAKNGDIVLLSPACASFGLFRHEFERGEAFIRTITNNPANSACRQADKK